MSQGDERTDKMLAGLYEKMPAYIFNPLYGAIMAQADDAVARRLRDAVVKLVDERDAALRQSEADRNGNVTVAEECGAREGETWAEFVRRLHGEGRNQLHRVRKALPIIKRTRAFCATTAKPENWNDAVRDIDRAINALEGPVPAPADNMPALLDEIWHLGTAAGYHGGGSEADDDPEWLELKAKVLAAAGQ